MLVAGKHGVIRVINANTRREIHVCPGFQSMDVLLVQVLRGHEGAVNDLRTSPACSLIVGSASADGSARVWNVRYDRCLAILGGHNGHRDQVLSLVCSVSV